MSSFDYRSLCRRAYQDTVNKDQTISSDFKRALKSHDRVPAFIDRMAGELLLVQNARIRRGKPIHSDKVIEGVVADMTRMFIYGIDQEAKSRYESDLAKLARQIKADEVADMQSTLDGKPKGAFEEMGLIDLDSRRGNVKEAAQKARSSD